MKLKSFPTGIDDTRGAEHKDMSGAVFLQSASLHHRSTPSLKAIKTADISQKENKSCIKVRYKLEAEAPRLLSSGCSPAIRRLSFSLGWVAL